MPVLWERQGSRFLILSFVFKNTNSKHQISNKFQIQIVNDQNI
jgi:hypothetical protein